MENLKKRYNIFIFASTFLLFGITAFALNPIFRYLSSDIVIYETVLPLLFYIFIELVRSAAFACGYAVVFSSALRSGAKSSISQIMIFFGSIIFYYLGDYVAISLQSASWELDVVSASSLLLDLFVQGLIICIGILLTTRTTDSSNKSATACAAIVMSGLKVLLRIIYDVQYGAPTSLGESAEMAVFYITDVLLGVFVYFLMRFLALRFAKWDKKEKANA